MYRPGQRGNADATLAWCPQGSAWWAVAVGGGWWAVAEGGGWRWLVVIGGGWWWLVYLDLNHQVKYEVQGLWR